MTVDKTPAMPVYVKDLYTDERVAVLSFAHQGLCLRLLGHQWLEGSIPASIDLIVALTGKAEARKLWPAVAQFFPPHPTVAGRLQNEKLEKVRADVTRYREAKVEAGRRGGSSKWGGEPHRLDSPSTKTRAARLAAARAKGTHSAAEWSEMVEFFGRCVKCGSANSLVKDHIVPIYQGGDDSIANIQPLCQSCNCAKGPERVDYRGSTCMQMGISPSEMPSKWLTDACLASASAFAEKNPPLSPRKRGERKPTLAQRDAMVGGDHRNEEEKAIERRREYEWLAGIIAEQGGDPAAGCRVVGYPTKRWDELHDEFKNGGAN